MSKIAVLCVNGVEEIECLTVVDFCRRLLASEKKQDEPPAAGFNRHD